MYKIFIPRGCSVFLLDDDDCRIMWFLERLSSVTVTKEARDAIAILDRYPEFDFIFLDHDLGRFTGTEGNGLEVAQHLASKGFTGKVFVHSHNADQAEEMHKLLKQATRMQWGQFEIESAYTKMASE